MFIEHSNFEYIKEKERWETLGNLREMLEIIANIDPTISERLIRHERGTIHFLTHEEYGTRVDSITLNFEENSVDLELLHPA